MGTVVKVCSCSHDYQDKKYGKYMRVHNIAGKSQDYLVCTVCGKKSGGSKPVVKQ